MTKITTKPFSNDPTRTVYTCETCERFSITGPGFISHSETCELQEKLAQAKHTISQQTMLIESTEKNRDMWAFAADTEEKLRKQAEEKAQRLMDLLEIVTKSARQFRDQRNEAEERLRKLSDSLALAERKAKAFDWIEKHAAYLPFEATRGRMFHWTNQKGGWVRDEKGWSSCGALLTTIEEAQAEREGGVL